MKTFFIGTYFKSDTLYIEHSFYRSLSTRKFYSEEIDEHFPKGPLDAHCSLSSAVHPTFTDFSFLLKVTDMDENLFHRNLLQVRYFIH